MILIYRMKYCSHTGISLLLVVIGSCWGGEECEELGEAFVAAVWLADRSVATSDEVLVLLIVLVDKPTEKRGANLGRRSQSGGGEDGTGRDAVTRQQHWISSTI